MTGRFIKVKCQDCGAEQVIFNKCTTQVRCGVCSAILALQTGGKAELKAKFIEVVG